MDRPVTKVVDYKYCILTLLSLLKIMFYQTVAKRFHSEDKKKLSKNSYLTISFFIAKYQFRRPTFVKNVL